LKDDYKHKEKFYNCFPELYEKLKQLVETKKRSLHEIEISQILPENIIFYSENIPFSSSFPKNRRKERIGWFERSLEHLKEADIIFVDPDNGIQTEAVTKTNVKAVKYVFWDEIKKYYDGKKSVIVYNHRDFSPVSKYDEKLLKINSLFKEKIDFRVLRFFKFSVRDYIFLIQPAHKNIIDSTFDTLTKKPYDFMFKEYYPEIKR
jgi:hypothetical protein